MSRICIGRVPGQNVQLAYWEPPSVIHIRRETAIGCRYGTVVPKGAWAGVEKAAACIASISAARCYERNVGGADTNGGNCGTSPN